jgi:hypothetical protein
MLIYKYLKQKKGRFLRPFNLRKHNKYMYLLYNDLTTVENISVVTG